MSKIIKSQTIVEAIQSYDFMPSQFRSMILDLIEQNEYDEPKTEIEMVADFRKAMNQNNMSLLDAKFVKSEDIFPFLSMLFEEFLELVQACGRKNIIDITALMETTVNDLNERMPNALENYEEEIFFDEVQDAITDMKYHLANLSLTTGLHEIDQEAFAIVHANNMTKVTTDPSQLNDIEEKYKVKASREPSGIPNHFVYKCEHDPAGKVPRGKVLKPIGYKAVNLGNFLREKLKASLPILLVLFLFSCSGCSKTELMTNDCASPFCVAEKENTIVHTYNFNERRFDPNIYSTEAEATSFYEELLKNEFRIKHDRVYCTCN